MPGPRRSAPHAGGRAGAAAGAQAGAPGEERRGSPAHRPAGSVTRPSPGPAAPTRPRQRLRSARSRATGSTSRAAGATIGSGAPSSGGVGLPGALHDAAGGHGEPGSRSRPPPEPALISQVVLPQVAREEVVGVAREEVVGGAGRHKVPERERAPLLAAEDARRTTRRARGERGEEAAGVRRARRRACRGDGASAPSARAPATSVRIATAVMRRTASVISPCPRRALPGAIGAEPRATAAQPPGTARATSRCAGAAPTSLAASTRRVVWSAGRGGPRSGCAARRETVHRTAPVFALAGTWADAPRGVPRRVSGRGAQAPGGGRRRGLRDGRPRTMPPPGAAALAARARQRGERHRGGGQCDAEACGGLREPEWKRRQTREQRAEGDAGGQSRQAPSRSPSPAAAGGRKDGPEPGGCGRRGAGRRRRSHAPNDRGAAGRRTGVRGCGAATGVAGSAARNGRCRAAPGEGAPRCGGIRIVLWGGVG
jgi:hypothetical protein